MMLLLLYKRYPKSGGWFTHLLVQQTQSFLWIGGNDGVNMDLKFEKILVIFYARRLEDRAPMISVDHVLLSVYDPLGDKKFESRAHWL